MDGPFVFHRELLAQEAERNEVVDGSLPSGDVDEQSVWIGEVLLE